MTNNRNASQAKELYNLQPETSILCTVLLLFRSGKAMYRSGLFSKQLLRAEGVQAVPHR